MTLTEVSQFVELIGLIALLLGTLAGISWTVAVSLLVSKGGEP